MKTITKRIRTIVTILLIGLVAAMCTETIIPTESNEEINYDDTPYDLSIGYFSEPDFGDNALTVEGVKLGRMLFYDNVLSGDNTMNCASCHLQDNAFSDPEQFSIGIEGLPGGRQAMAIFNTAWHTNEFFWDGRAHLLRDQSLKPIEDALELNTTLELVVAKLETGNVYRDQFKRAFGTEDVTEERISLALEQFMNTIVSNQSKYDKWGSGEAQFTDSEERGRMLYFTEYDQFFPQFSGADCQHCHGGNNFADNDYMNNGLDAEANIEDIGRMEVTGEAMDNGKFKIPSLRNIELTAPYMHDGRFETLEEVVDHYDHGIAESPSLDPALRNTTSTGLRLTAQDKADLIAFLKTLTDETIATDERFSSPFDN